MNDGADIAGRSIDDAADLVVGRGEAEDRSTARATLETVADDGTVSWAAARDAFAHLSKVVSTPETRLELAATELEDARASAAGVEPNPLVRTRVETFEARYESIEERVTELGTDLRQLLDRRDEAGALYEVATGIQSLTAEANDCQRAADELQVDLQAFQRWLGDPSVRYETLGDDIDALERSVDDLEAIADSITGADAPADPAAQWAGAVRQRQVLALVLEDLQWELAELREWERGGEAATVIDDRLDALDGRLTRLRGQLDDAAEPAWTDQYADRLAAVESALDAFDPPVDWGEVDAVLEADTGPA